MERQSEIFYEVPKSPLNSRFHSRPTQITIWDTSRTVVDGGGSVASPLNKTRRETGRDLGRQKVHRAIVVYNSYSPRTRAQSRSLFVPLIESRAKLW